MSNIALSIGNYEILTNEYGILCQSPDYPPSKTPSEMKYQSLTRDIGADDCDIYFMAYHNQE